MSLTHRELSILVASAESGRCLTTREAADKLQITSSTVRGCIPGICRKLGVSTLGEAVNRAQLAGHISPGALV